MKQTIKKLVNGAMYPLGLSINNISALNKYKEDYLAYEALAKEMNFILAYPQEDAYKYLQYRKLSKSQIKQDLFVLFELNFLRNGFFVEFGATNGVLFSNTFLLEKEFQWTGILAEPARGWHTQLEENRGSNIEKNCVWSKTGEVLSFNEVEQGELSTVVGFGDDDHHKKARAAGKNYQVETISLLDLLKKYNAPSTIDYISIDTEGSEYEILKNFDFDKYKFRVMTIEHNYTVAREKIHSLLNSKGYVRIKEEFSLCDDWYVLKS